MEYERSHPWLKFSLNMGQLPWKTWMLLGEAQSKLEHLSSVPLRPITAAQLHRLYLAKGALATTAIEGNTLSEEDVVKHLNGELQLPPSKEYLAKEIDNIVDSCKWIWEHNDPLTTELIQAFNERVLRGLKVSEEVVPGQIRQHSVGVPQYRGAPWQECKHLLDKLCSWLDEPEFQGTPETALAFAIVRSVIAHLYLAWIHPFGDGNGRTARLIEFKILAEAGVPAPAAQLLSNHYNETRSEYYRQLNYASKSNGDVIPFLCYAIQGFVDGLRAQLSLIREQQLDVVWRNYVHELYRNEKSANAERQKHLILDLSRLGTSVDKVALVSVSARVASAYAPVHPKTLQRDLHDLINKGLLEFKDGKYRARTEIIIAFLPDRHGLANDNSGVTSVYSRVPFAPKKNEKW